MSKPKILILTQNFHPEIGSHANRINNIFQLLQMEGYEVSVLTTEPSYPNKHLYEDRKFWDNSSLNNSSNIHRVHVKNRKYAFSMLNRLIYYIEISLKMLFYVLFDKQKYDAVFVTSPAIFTAFVGVIAKFRYKAKFVLDIRDLWPESLKGVGVFNNNFIIKFFSILEVYLYRKANHIVINSVGFLDYIVKKAKVDSNKIIFIPNAAREYELNPVNKNHEQFRVIYTGNIGLAQDVNFLKKLVHNLAKNHIRITIVGYGQKKNELLSFIKENNLQNVTIKNPTTRNECLKLNARHDVGVLALNNKDVFDTVLPGKLIDYMSSGLPVVAAVSGYSRQLIEKNKTGFVSENRDADEIVEYILMLKNNPKLREETANNSSNLIRDHFLWEKNIKKLTSLFEEDFRFAEAAPLNNKVDRDITL
ncbi:glycosyltransferase family 4 protein [Viridibacillus sp. YIM B01967]|uniref:Glycosyltransferase family 4 protein n=1 Tax=Viridibacillus soli TaxID=2798301 RepID=A0ABS1H2Z2_9BACL|nr:glycosyltransferase family 4 protein [Viridibacillus soli]MBK3493774.1 glycosyltransferase family 4 protein [Viridibacillus soli]